MTKRKLDLSHTLSPLDDELFEILNELLALKKEESPLFSAAIDDFIHKYGEIKYQSLDELLESAAVQAQYSQKEIIPLDDLIKDLTS